MPSGYSRCPLSECSLGAQRPARVVPPAGLEEPRPVPSVPSVPYQSRVEERIWPVSRVGYEERVVEVPQVVVKERVEEEPRVVYAEKVRYVPRPEIVERTTHVPKRIEKEVLVDVPQVKYVHRTVSVPAPIFQEEVVAVPRPVVKERPVYVSKPVFVEKVVEVPRVQIREVPVEKIVEVPQVRVEYKYKDVRVPQQLFRSVSLPKSTSQSRGVLAGKAISTPMVEVRQTSAPVSEPLCLLNCCTSRRGESRSSERTPMFSSLSTGRQRPAVRFYSQPPTPQAYVVEGIEKDADDAACCVLPATPRIKQKERRALTPSSQRGRFTLKPSRGSRKPIDVKVSKLSPRKVRGACGMCTGYETPVDSDGEYLEHSYPTPLPPVVSSFTSYAPTDVPAPAYYTASAVASPVAGEPWIRTKFGDMPFSEFERLNNSDALAEYVKTLGGYSRPGCSEKASLETQQRVEHARRLQVQEELTRKQQEENERVQALEEWKRQERLRREEELRSQREEAAKQEQEERMRREEEARRQREEEERKAREERERLEEQRRQREEEYLQRYIEEQRKLAEEQQRCQLKKQQEEIERLLKEQERQRKEQESRQAQFLQQQQETLKRLQQEQLKQQKQLQEEMKEHQQRLAQQQDQLRLQQEQAIKKLQQEHEQQQQRLAARLQQSLTLTPPSAGAAHQVATTFTSEHTTKTNVYVETRFGLMAFEDFERLNREDPLKDLRPAVVYESSTYAPSPVSPLSTARHTIPSELLYQPIPAKLQWQQPSCQVAYAPQRVVYHSQEEALSVNPRLLDFSAEGREARSQAEEIGRTSAEAGRQVYHQVRGALNSEASVEAFRAVGDLISGVFHKFTSTAPMPSTQ